MTKRKKEEEIVNTKKCQYCKSEIDAEASVCPHCKKEQHSNIFSVIVVILIIIGIIWVFNRPDNNKEKSAIVSNGDMKLNTVYQEYVDNKVRAKEKYEGKYYTFTGVIKDFSSDILNEPMIYLNFKCKKGTCEAVVYFRKEESTKISKLNKKDKHLLVK